MPRRRDGALPPSRNGTASPSMCAPPWQSAKCRSTRGSKNCRNIAGWSRSPSSPAQHSTTVPQALERYVAAEEFLTRDPVNGIRELCRMYGVAPAQIAGMEGTSGDEAEGGYQTPRQPPVDPMVYQLASEINALKSAVASREQGEVQSVLTHFAADPRHRYFENVRQVMGVLMQSGQASDLEAAYETACWANPQIRAALINEQAEARRQAKRAGGPECGIKGPQRRQEHRRGT